MQALRGEKAVRKLLEGGKLTKSEQRGWRPASRLLKKRIFSSARYCIDDDVRIAV
jgi:hypothetical protein